MLTSLVRPDPETRPNPTRTRPRPRFGCTRPKIYTRRVGRVLNSRPGSGSGCPPGHQVLGLACLPTRLYTRPTHFYTRRHTYQAQNLEARRGVGRTHARNPVTQ